MQPLPRGERPVRKPLPDSSPLNPKNQAPASPTTQPNSPVGTSPTLGRRPAGSSHSLGAMRHLGELPPVPEMEELHLPGAAHQDTLPRATSEQFLSRYGANRYPEFPSPSAGTTSATPSLESSPVTLSGSHYLPHRNPLDVKPKVKGPAHTPEEIKAKLGRIEERRDNAKKARDKSEPGTPNYTTADFEYQNNKLKAKEFKKENAEVLTGRKPFGERVKSFLGRKED